MTVGFHQTTLCFAVFDGLLTVALGWRGRNERTGLDGIFPRSYVSVIDEKAKPISPQPTSYGNMPLEVSQTGSSGEGKRPTKFEENGKKFGKKMGNAGMLESHQPWFCS
jgi:hypothetical protein